MPHTRTIAEWMTERGLTADGLVAATGLDDGIVTAIVEGRYTPSPEQRRRLAGVLGVGVEQIAWGHKAQVSHVHGHGPQFGRSP
jgi:transcriptional regulator with XRE-family HTH domain